MNMMIIRLGTDDKQILDRLALEFGSREQAIRQALRTLGADLARRDAFQAFMAAWATEPDPVDGDTVAAMAQHYGL